MATQRTAKGSLEYWQRGDRNWHVPYQRSLEWLAATSPVGGLAVSPASVDAAMASDSLNVRVGAGSYAGPDGAVLAYAGTSSYAIASSSTRRVYLDAAGTLADAASWPAAWHVRLATVVTGASTITSVTDERIVCGRSGAAVATLTGATTLDGTHSVVKADATVAAFTVTLPTAVGVAGRTYRIIRVNSGGNAVTVDTTSAQTINGASTISLGSQWASAVLVSDGTNWLRF